MPETDSIVRRLFDGIRLECGMSESQWHQSVDVNVVFQYMKMCLPDTSENDEEAIEEIVDTLIAYVPQLDSASRSKVCLLVRDAVAEVHHSGHSASPSSQEDMNTAEELSSLSLALDPDHVASKPSPTKTKRLKNSVAIDAPDAEISRIIVQKHFMIQESSTHTPSVALIDRPSDSKSKVRYRDGQIVSTKGDRFLEEKRQDSEEMKKTYINLKPLRKYRFH